MTKGLGSNFEKSCNERDHIDTDLSNFTADRMLRSSLSDLRAAMKKIKMRKKICPVLKV